MATQKKSRAGQFSVDRTIIDGISQAGSFVTESIQQTENYVRREPVCAVCYSVLAGYLLRFFPFISLFRAFISLILTLLRPLAFLYVLAKAFEIAERSGGTVKTPDSKLH